MEKLDLTQILEDCPKGTKLYSPIFGEVEFNGIDHSMYNPIRVIDDMGQECAFKKNGKFYNYKNAECMLFPSRENRDWSTFKSEQPELQFAPKQWVLVRNGHSHDPWRLGIFSHYRGDCAYPYACVSGNWGYCLPYEGNEALLGTTNKPKEE